LSRNTYDFDELLPAFKILQELELDSMLDRMLSEDNARTVVALAVNHVVDSRSVSNARTWY
jgi:hypothetical protein